MSKDKVEIPVNNNQDTNYPNETSQKFDHPRAAAEKELERDNHYVSLKKIEKSDKDNGVVVKDPNRFANTRGVSSGYGLKNSSFDDIKQASKERGAQPTEQTSDEKED